MGERRESRHDRVARHVREVDVKAPARCVIGRERKAQQAALAAARDVAGKIEEIASENRAIAHHPDAPRSARRRTARRDRLDPGRRRPAIGTRRRRSVPAVVRTRALPDRDRQSDRRQCTTGLQAGRSPHRTYRNADACAVGYHAVDDAEPHPVCRCVHLCLLGAKRRIPKPRIQAFPPEMCASRQATASAGTSRRPTPQRLRRCSSRSTSMETERRSPASTAPAAGSGAFDCSAMLPTLSTGTHTLELASFVVDGSATIESPRSAPLRVICRRHVDVELLNILHAGRHGGAGRAEPCAGRRGPVIFHQILHSLLTDRSSSPSAAAPCA